MCISLISTNILFHLNVFLLLQSKRVHSWITFSPMFRHSYLQLLTIYNLVAVYTCCGPVAQREFTKTTISYIFTLWFHDPYYSLVLITFYNYSVPIRVLEGMRQVVQVQARSYSASALRVWRDSKVQMFSVWQNVQTA